MNAKQIVDRLLEADPANQSRRKQSRPGFEEVTYIGTHRGFANDEVMVWREAGSGRIRDIYVFNNSPLVRSEDWEFKPGKNPLFLHLSSRRYDQFIADIEALGYEEWIEAEHQNGPAAAAPPRTAREGSPTARG